MPSAWCLVLKQTYDYLWCFLIPVAGAFLAWLILPEESPDWMSVTVVVVTGISLLLLNMKGSLFGKRKKPVE